MNLLPQTQSLPKCKSGPKYGEGPSVRVFGAGLGPPLSVCRRALIQIQWYWQNRIQRTAGVKANMFLPSIFMPFDQEQASGPAGQEALASAGVRMCCWTSQQIPWFQGGASLSHLSKTAFTALSKSINCETGASSRNSFSLISVIFNHRCLSVTTNPPAEHPFFRAVCLVVKSTISLEEIGLANQGQSHPEGFRWQYRLQLARSQRQWEISSNCRKLGWGRQRQRGLVMRAKKGCFQDLAICLAPASPALTC